MATYKESRIKGYYLELKKVIDNQNYGKVVKVCNKIISEDDQEVKAWQSKLTAQIHMSDFDGGLHCLKKCTVLEHLLFEKAYCEYRLNEIEEAWETIANAPPDSPLRVKELQAQILYRLERYDECFTKYRELIKTTSDHFDQERLTNLAAVSVNRIYEGSNEKGPKVGSDATYEQLYNNASEMLSLGQVQQSLKQLQKAECLCRSVLAQDSTPEDEINEECAVIRVQQGHCLQLLKREKEALAIYNAVLKTKPDDPALMAIINNNLITINRDGNVFDSRKRIKIATAPGLEHKLTSRQRGSIALNQCLLAYTTNQEKMVDEVIASESAHICENFPSLSLSVAIIKSAQLGRAGKAEESMKVLKNYAENHPELALKAILSSAHILLLQKSYEPTIRLLASLEDKYKNSNGIVSAMLVLCSTTDKTALASQILKEAVHWHKNNESSSSNLNNILRRATDFHLRTNDPISAVETLQELRKLDPSNRNTLARLISAYSQFDSEMAQNLSKELPDPSACVATIDAEALENSFGLKYSRKQAKDAADASPSSPNARKIGSPKEAKEQEKKKKKKKKTRLPKNYVPGHAPDPDRWLPKWQRKGYKKKRDRRRRQEEVVMKGTQGISSDAADKFDITKTAGQHKPTHASSPKVDAAFKRNIHQKKKGKKKRN